MMAQSKRQKQLLVTHPSLILDFKMDEDFKLQGVAEPSRISHKKRMS